MKFLCVECDEGLKLTEASGPDESGSLAVVFRCPKCSHEVAMLTNAHETQLVSSLGVKIGPGGEAVKKESKCPFTGVVQSLIEKQEPSISAKPDLSSGSELQWTEQALLRLNKIPEFIRPIAKAGIENLARNRGLTLVDEGLLDIARE